MTRYVQQENRPVSKEEVKPTPKFGGKEGRKDYSVLAEGKKIPTKEGYK